MEHPGPDRIYRVAPTHEATIALENDSLAGPNGITWDGAAGRFIIVPFFGKTSSAWAPGRRRSVPLGPTTGQLDGVEVLGGEPVPDHQLGRLEPRSCSSNGTVTPVSTDLPSPADIGVDTKRNRVAIPLLHGEPGRVPRAAGAREGGVHERSLTYAAVGRLGAGGGRGGRVGGQAARRGAARSRSPPTASGSSTPAAPTRSAPTSPIPSGRPRRRP